MKFLSRVIREESGQDLIEYALLASLISIVSVAALNVLGPTVAQLFVRVNDAFGA
jgi:pilus assembly protein Flp/PilA